LETIKGENFNVLSGEIGDVLIKEMGWTRERAEGYLEGQQYRRQRLAPTEYHKVGIDEYALGFRAGYFRPINVVSQVRFEKIS
jgi:hypothetical protein